MSVSFKVKVNSKQLLAAKKKQKQPRAVSDVDDTPPANPPKRTQTEILKENNTARI